jgi:hypothetical protein
VKIEIDVIRPAWLRLPRTWRARALLMLALAGVVAVPVALAAHQFADVPDTNPHHADIGGIALAGITTGCNPPANTNYCPDQFVRRDQMASFLRRGLGRVALSSHESLLSASTGIPPWHSFTITPGLPQGALDGAQGFIKGDASLTFQLTNATGCPCRFRGALYLRDSGYMSPRYADVVLSTVGEVASMSLTGARETNVAGPNTVDIELFRADGGGTAFVYGNASALYVPFGSDGGNVLGKPERSPAGPNTTSD